MARVEKGLIGEMEMEEKRKKQRLEKKFVSRQLPSHSPHMMI
jgi:hypothetical protein